MSESYVIDYLELPSADGAASRAFFEAAFGWSFVSYGPTYVATSTAGIETGVQSEIAEATSAPLPIVRASDLEQALIQVVGAGGIVTREPFDFPGGRRFHFREPGGAELAVWMSREG